MSRLSGHGVKQVLQPILQSLPTESQWKSRQEALRLLGMMAHCAPKQLSACLPQIIPRLGHNSVVLQIKLHIYYYYYYYYSTIRIKFYLLLYLYNKLCIAILMISHEESIVKSVS